MHVTHVSIWPRLATSAYRSSVPLVAQLRDVLQAAQLIRIPIEDTKTRLAVIDGLKAIFTQRLRRERSVRRVARPD